MPQYTFDRVDDGEIHVTLCTEILVAVQQAADRCSRFVTIITCNSTSCRFCHDTTACCQGGKASTGQGYRDGCAPDIGQRRLNAGQVIRGDVTQATLSIDTHVVEVEGPQSSCRTTIGEDSVVARTCFDIGIPNTIDINKVVTGTSFDVDVVQDRLVELVVVVVFWIKRKLNRGGRGLSDQLISSGLLMKDRREDGKTEALYS